MDESFSLIKRSFRVSALSSSFDKSLHIMLVNGLMISITCVITNLRVAKGRSQLSRVVRTLFSVLFGYTASAAILVENVCGPVDRIFC